MSTQQQVAAHDYKGGEIVEFVKYETDLGPGEEPLLEPGDRMKVTKVNDDGGLVCVVIDKHNKEVTSRQPDTVFPDEIKLLEAESAPAEPRSRTAKGKAKATEPAPAAVEAKGKGKSKGKAAAAPAPAAETAETKTGKEIAAKAIKEKEKEKAKATKAKGKAKSAKPATAKVGDNSKAKAAEAPARPAIQHDATVIELINEQGAVEAVKVLLDASEQTYFQIGGLLWEINERGLHEHHGFEGTTGFHDFVEAELGVKYQKAKNLMEIYEVFRDPRVLRKLTPNRLKKLGWSKAKQLARLGVEQLVENWDDVFEIATTKTRDELTAHIKTKYVVATRGADRVKATTFTFKLVGDAANTINRALDLAKTKTGEDDGNKAFEYICGDWLNVADGVDRQPEFADVDTLIAYAEEKFGATLTQVDGE